MQLNNARILLTGASGGLGQALAGQLRPRPVPSAAGRPRHRAPGRTDRARSGPALQCPRRPHPPGRHRCRCRCRTRIRGQRADQQRRYRRLRPLRPAGLGHRGRIAGDQPGGADAPDAGAAARLKAQPQAAIVNIGSTFGSLPFAGFAAYSAAKAGLRGFSQALRRELADTPRSPSSTSRRARSIPRSTPRRSTRSTAP
jgi:NAD(P)-dependent dehydrogenase (short-subunit alcohol dehydrogenase family)